MAEFEPGCATFGGAIVCGPGGTKIRTHGQCLGLCGKADARLVQTIPNSPYYPSDFLCECGDRFCPSEDWLYPRPFERGWRPKAQQRFARDWDAAFPEGRPTRDSDCYLVGVVLPDGTEVSR